MPGKKVGLLERLASGQVVVGDGGFVFALEKRGYVKAGPWTPEAVVEHPEAVRQLHREFLRAGADVMQAFTFYASDDKLENRGNVAQQKHGGSKINSTACSLARSVADEGSALVAGGISQTPSYLSGLGKAAVAAEFKKQADVFRENKVDFIICEYFEHVEEMEWAIETAKTSGLPVCSTMCICAEGDLHGVSAADCAVRMAKAGADVVGVNCHFDPWVSLNTLKAMKAGLEKAGGKYAKTALMIQPLAFLTPDAKKQGFIDLPEFPFGLEPRVSTRWEIQEYAKQAYELGVRYIGGCCGFEPYHIRAISEQLSEMTSRPLPPASDKHGAWGDGLRLHTKPWVRARANREYWASLKPASGRPLCAAMSKPDQWGVTAGDEQLKQSSSATSDAELTKLKAKA